jgi:hypothetical protein
MFKVVTTASEYLIDFDSGKAMRLPGPDAPDLRRDGKWFYFKSIDIQIGESMVIVAKDISSEGYTTVRMTSPVVEIVDE